MSLLDLMGDDEETLSPEVIAWKTQDWDAVKKFAATYKTEAENDYIHTLKSLTQDKRRIAVDLLDSYQPFLINNHFAKDTATIQHASFMNYLVDISPQMHYDYYLHTVRQERLRWAAKPNESEIIDEIVEKVFCKVVAIKWELGPDKSCEYVNWIREDGKESEIKRMLAPIVTDVMIKSVAPYANKTQINKSMTVIEGWSK